MLPVVGSTFNADSISRHQCDLSRSENGIMNVSWQYKLQTGFRRRRTLHGFPSYLCPFAKDWMFAVDPTMCVCVLACARVCASVLACMWCLCASMRVRVCTYVHTRTYVRTHVRTYVRTHARKHVRTYVCIYLGSPAKKVSNL